LFQNSKKLQADKFSTRSFLSPNGTWAVSYLPLPSATAEKDEIFNLTWYNK